LFPDQRSGQKRDRAALHPEIFRTYHRTFPSSPKASQLSLKKPPHTQLSSKAPQKYKKSRTSFQLSLFLRNSFRSPSTKR